MKKIILSLFVLLAVWCSAFAGKQLVVELKDGGTVTYVLNDEPVVTFQDTRVCVRSQKAEAAYERASVARFFFQDAATDVENIKGNLRIEYLSDQVVIYGTSDAKVYDTAGRLLAPQITTSDESVTISLESLTEGMYIISIPNHPSVKIKKQ